jgi:hypothetical protein
MKYANRAAGDVEFIHWLMLANSMLTRVRLWANNMRTRGPTGGHHVSLIVWLFGFWFISSKVWQPWGSNR